ncbi:hypothetical protein B5M09_009866 [Aphanomyces astaci]|uniref:Uncharacterized protein n=1 Tax=Aphanomyces astaci TaxID=112090 RepID=A0A425DCH7_APHAT|nr:hypothetical protein B5M09_009866 [Aphanomyces astaci]
MKWTCGSYACVETSKCGTTTKDGRSASILLKQFMLIRKLRGDPKELYEAALETKLLKIINEPKNGVEADIPLLFHGIHMDMKEDDVLSRKIFKRLLEVMDPDPVRDACVLDMEKAWHPVEFTWESISELVIHHAQEQQRFYSTYSAGRKKPGYEAKAAKNKKENRKGDYSRQEQRDLDETVHTTHLPTVLVGSAVGNLPVTAKKTVELRTTLSAAAEQVKLPGKQLFYVVDNNDELIVRKYALISIGLDMDRLLEQVAVRQIHEDGDNIGDPGADEDIAFGVSVRGLRANDKQLDVEDMRAAENLYKVATTSANAADQAQAATFKQLQGIVVDAATKAVWGTKFRGTDLPANVKAMELRLKTGARPYRCKPRKVHSTYTKPNDHDGRGLLEGFGTSCGLRCSTIFVHLCLSAGRCRVDASIEGSFTEAMDSTHSRLSEFVCAWCDIGGFITRANIVSRVEDAWSDMASSHIINGFMKCTLTPCDGTTIVSSDPIVDVDCDMDDVLYVLLAWSRL